MKIFEQFSEYRPEINIYALQAFLESIRSDTVDMIFGLEPGQYLFHYTDLAGFKGIINNHDLWLTHSRYSNDEEEMLHGYRATNDVIEEVRDSRQENNWRSYINLVSEYLKKPAPEGVYICCFCQEDNLLSQWRSYGANGTGVSVKFDPGGFSSVTGPDSPHGGLMRMWKVFYEPDKQRDILKKAIYFAYELMQSQQIEEKARQAVDAIEFFIPTFKNQDFCEETEWRLIFSPPPNCFVRPEFRVARGMLVPYYSLKALAGLQHLPINGVRIGPGPQKRLNIESVQMLLNQAGYAGLKVEWSDTPYRG